MKTPTQNRSAAIPLKERLYKFINLYCETTEPVEPMQGTTGALKTAFKRASQYNDPKKRTSAPKPA